MDEQEVEIGGYFSFEFESNDNSNHFHKHSVKLNSARNCLEYILQNINVKKVYIPYYNCTVVLEPFIKNDIDYEFYHLDRNLEIVCEPNLNEAELILYVNYFGIKSDYVRQLIDKYSERLIIDNSQAFFSKFQENIFSIYSPRKFFGVADGGYLIGKDLDRFNKVLDFDHSLGRVSHLIGRIEYSAEKYFLQYKENDADLNMNSVKKMSKFTYAMLSNINYQKVIEKRNENFNYLHAKLAHLNEMSIYAKFINGPLVYPLLYKSELKNYLIQNKVYVATYWGDALTLSSLPNTEKYLIKNMVCLPIDQRYDTKHMDRIVKLIEDYNNVQK